MLIGILFVVSSVSEEDAHLELEVEKPVALEEQCEWAQEAELVKGSASMGAKINLWKTSKIGPAENHLEGQTNVLEVEASIIRFEQQHEITQKSLFEHEIVPKRGNGPVMSTEPIALEEIQAGGCGGGALDKIRAAGMRRPSIALATVTKQWLDHDRADVPQREPASVSIFPNDVDHFSCSPIPSKVNFTSSDHQAFAAGANSDMEHHLSCTFNIIWMNHNRPNYVLRFLCMEQYYQAVMMSPSTIHRVSNEKKLLTSVEHSPSEIHGRNLNRAPVSMDPTAIGQQAIAVLLLDPKTVCPESLQDDEKLEKQLGQDDLSSSELERGTHGDSTLYPLHETTVDQFLPATMATSVAISKQCIMLSESPSSSEAGSLKPMKSHIQKAENGMVLLSEVAAEQQHTLSSAPSAITMVLEQKAQVMKDFVQYESFRGPASTRDEDAIAIVHQPTKRQKLMDTYQIDKQLQQAQCHTQDAMISATAALAQTHYFWAQLQAENSCSNPAAVREAQIASVRATIVAATSINRFAVVAAEAIADASNEVLRHLALQQDQHAIQGLMSCEAAAQVLSFQVIPNRDYEGGAQPMQVQSGINTEIYELVKKKQKCNETTPLKSVTKKVKHSNSKRATTRQDTNFPTRDRDTCIVTECRGVQYKEVDSSIQDGRQSFEKSSGSGSLRLMASMPKVTNAERLQIVEVGSVQNTSEMIEPGSHVEVMPEEEGLRGVWFSAKVLKLKDKKVLVLYDELLTEDGHLLSSPFASGKSQLEEWFPLRCSRAETRDWHPVEQRKLRPMHPFCFSKARGSLKRHHVAVGSHVWLVGDRVDAFIQDGSELLFLKSCSDIDAWRLAGEKDTAVVKLQNLRPSLIWTDGQWTSWKELSLWEDGYSSKPKKMVHDLTKGKEKQIFSQVPKMTDIELNSSPRPRKTRQTDANLNRNPGESGENKYPLNVGKDLLTSTRELGLEYLSNKQGIAWTPPLSKNGLSSPERLALVVATPPVECAQKFEELRMPKRRNQGQAALKRQPEIFTNSKVNLILYEYSQY
ncbi:unnamed protein product [Sphagnum jensenii]|uniref:Agenet-like domain-containing protein n=1 Tax=Sphagnum jensenii TaxID=128206 RepID=A0ABP0WJT1_9BRYO